MVWRQSSTSRRNKTLESQMSSLKSSDAVENSNSEYSQVEGRRDNVCQTDEAMVRYRASSDRKKEDRTCDFVRY